MAARRPAARLILSLAWCPNLPPQQSLHHQVKIGGKIRLASGRGLWMCANHKQATFRQGPQVPCDHRP
jgi:hypothetical protein